MIIRTEIDGKEIAFNTSLNWMYYYQFLHREDPIDILRSIEKALENNGKPIKDTDGNETGEILDLENKPLDLFGYITGTQMLDVLYCLAANADSEIQKKSALKWYSEFEDFDAIKVFYQVLPDLMKSMVSTKNLTTLSKIAKKVQK